MIALDIVTGSASENLMLVLLAETGGAERFQRPPGDFSVLAERPQGGSTRTLPDGTVFEFDAAGRQTARIDRCQP